MLKGYKNKYNALSLLPSVTNLILKLKVDRAMVLSSFQMSVSLELSPVMMTFFFSAINQ